MNVIVKIYCDC